MIIMRGRNVEPPELVMEEVTDPAEIARSKEQHERAMRNLDWLSGHWDQLLPQAYGKFVAIAAQEAFIADTPGEAWQLAKTAHPEDNGAISQYVKPPGGPRIYANSR
jgi:hypothetical protein